MSALSFVAAESTLDLLMSSASERELRVARLGDEIATLAARLHSATYQLLVLLREFDACDGWSNVWLSCAHWLHWRTGIDLGAAREKVRVARALTVLPVMCRDACRPCCSLERRKLGKDVFLLDADFDENSKPLLHVFDVIKHKFDGGTPPIYVHECLRRVFGDGPLGYTLQPGTPIAETDARMITTPR